MSQDAWTWEANTERADNIRCRICHRPSEWGGEACNRCLDAPVWRLLLRHPVRCVVTGWLYKLGVIS